MPRILSLGTRLGVGFAFVYLGICLLMYVRQRSFVFPGTPDVIQPTADQVILQAPGMLYRWVDPPTADAPVIVYFHGNKAQILRDTFIADWASEAGAGFAAVEYPGYGLMPGEPSEQSFVAAARAALEHITGPGGIARERIRLSGQSIGTGVTMAMAAEGWGTRVLLISPYTSLIEVASHQYPWLPIGLLMKDRFDSFGRAPGIPVPVRILHGDQDAKVPLALGRRLAERLPQGELITLPGATHDNMWEQPQIRELYTSFLVGER